MKLNPIELTDPSLYLNRDLSMLAFHRRVYEMARDPNVPLLERLRFLCISISNLDEFFEVRVAAQKDRVDSGDMKVSPDGLSATATLVRMREEATQLQEDQYRVFNEELIPAMLAEGIHIVRRTEWNEAQMQWSRKFFRTELMPILTPISLDPAHPLPRVLNKLLNFIVTLEGKDAFGRDLSHAIVQMPRPLPRVIRMPKEVADPNAEHSFALLSSIIHAHVGELFPGMKVTSCHQFRVTRNSELYVDEEEVDDLKKALAGELLERRFGEAVRLEVTNNCTPELTDFLAQQFKVKESDVYVVNGPVNLYRLSIICDEVDRPELKFPPFNPSLPERLLPGPEEECVDMFRVIAEGDVLLHHPFQSFAPVVDLLNQAASDPDVLAIKQTLYRVVPNSPLVDALAKAARAGKEVIAVIELRARFNEEDNILLADRLHAAGAKVVYGVVGYKTHGKMMLIVRREGKQMRRYVHLGTGNYHNITSRIYTDFGLLSADPALGEDVHQMFQQLTGMGKATKLKAMLQSPFTLHAGLIERIDREAKIAASGGKGRIIAKMNGLEEPEVIRHLYRASQQGVKIDLMVRGTCCLRPGIPGISENIRVRSLLGRFLEHSRVFYFENGGEPDLFCASADWMSRNLLRRVETCFPIQEESLRKRVIAEGLRTYLADNSSTWQLKADGSYHRIRSTAKPRNAQQELLQEMGSVQPTGSDTAV
ncbi:MAG TPA: polyphosphate kinase 1 [Mariprofundaceae bacterium]|nr:polyphosphate kinase 1 [Mariprofundaceae bacterium]